METTAAPALYLGGRVAWDSGFLVVTDPELLAKVDRPYLSASTSKAVHSCPARMVSDKAVPSGFDLFGATEKGSAAHTVLERMYALAPGRRDEQHAMAILTEMSREAPQGDDDVDYARAIGQDPVRYNQWIAAIYASYKGLFAIEDPKTVEVHSTEMRFDGVEVAGVPFKGFIDRLDRLDDGLKVVDYKGLALDTPIPTPTGWTTMGALKVGDQVLGTAGVPVNVTIKSQVHNRPCYRVTFSDRSTVVCDNVHLWSITDAGSTSVLGADELFARFTAAPAGSLTITNAAALDLPEVDLPVSPWDLARDLSHADRIPVTYLRASRDQRLQLLRGLMWCRGTWGPGPTADLRSSTASATESIAELVASLGETPSLWGNDVQVSVDLLDRDFDSPVAPTARTITAMERTDSVPTQCIQVDAPDSLYLCGPLMVPTHNTGKDKSKTNPRFDDDHGDQIRLYVEAVRAKTGEKPRAGYLLYITHGKQRRVAISDTEVNKTKRGFAASWVALRTAVDTQRFEAKTSALCGWCSLVNSCPVGIAAGKVDRKGGAPSAIDLGIPSLRPDGTLIPLVGHTSRWDETGVQALPGAAHLLGEEEISRTDEGNSIMATSDRKWKEAKPYEGSDIDGHLSLNSYAATAVFGMTSLAAELLVKGGQKVGPAPVKALAGLLATVVMDAQAAVTNGSRDWQEGANTRLRGVLRTSLDVIPLPFGQDEAAWAKWVARTHTFITTVAATAIDLYDNGPVVDLGALASATILVAVPAAA